MTHIKVLFLLKQSDVYGNYSSSTSKSGLLNSARITAYQITKHLGIPTNVEICKDGNEVDKFVFRDKPTICVIEALWVTPLKLAELVKLHRKVKFIVLLHSNIPFLSNEGNAIAWIREYEKINNVSVGFNSSHAVKDFSNIGINTVYLPNIYFDVTVNDNNKPECDFEINIGMFGAIRPMKNQLIQAIAAIIFSHRNRIELNFHINSTRPEQGGGSVLKNIHSLFHNQPKCKLIEHDWQDRKEFLELVSTMDIGMQISFSETFNIVSADFVLQNVPIVVSDQIEWMPAAAKASMYDTYDMVEKLIHNLRHRRHVIKHNVKSLTQYNIKAIGVWHTFFKTI